MTTNIVIIGVGGQGTLLASRILGAVAISQGYDVKVSEVHGMSQRGGSVITYVRYGDAVASPIISEGCADTVLAFEELEALRGMNYLKAGGRMIVNTQQISPMPVITGVAEYPKNILGTLGENCELTTVDAHSLATQAGNSKAANVALIGVLAKHSAIEKDIWVKAIETTVPAKFLDANLKAFELGYNN